MSTADQWKMFDSSGAISIPSEALLFCWNSLSSWRTGRAGAGWGWGWFGVQASESASQRKCQTADARSSERRRTATLTLKSLVREAITERSGVEDLVLGPRF